MQLFSDNDSASSLNKFRLDTAASNYKTCCRAFGSQGMGLPEKSSPFLAHTRQNSAVNREFCVSDGQDLCPDIGLVQSDNP